MCANVDFFPIYFSCGPTSLAMSLSCVGIATEQGVELLVGNLVM